MTSAKKKSILLVAPEPLYPARVNGISIRYAPVIETLASEMDIDVAVILREGVPFEQIDDLKKLCRATYLYERKFEPTSKIKKGMVRIEKCLGIGTPYTHYCYDALKIRKFLKSISKDHAYDSIIWVSSAYLDIGIDVFGAKNIVVDSIDSVYNQFARKRERRTFDYFDRMHLKKWELRFIQRTKATIFVSEVDAQLYSEHPEAKGKVHVIPNGVYLTDFHQKKSNDIAPLPASSDRSDIRIGFLGNMGYQPNIDAAVRLKRIYDQVKKARTNAQLLIIGRTPAKEITVIGNGNDIIVTGTVDNIWPYVNAVDIFVFPMVSGAGQQNKLLEAMLAKKPVIANQLANSGIGGVSGEHLVICDTDNEFIDAIIRLIDHPDQRASIGSAGHKFVNETYDWSHLIPRMQTLWFS